VDVMAGFIFCGLDWSGNTKEGENINAILDLIIHITKIFDK
jgi:hypothetical protein